MDGQTLHRRIYYGRGKAAQHIGMPCNIFRPQNATAPFTNQVGTTPVAFNSGDTKYLHANEYNDPIWYADYDGTKTMPGDYLVRISDGRAWFVAAQQQLLPIMVTDCNASVMVRRQAPSTGFGAEPYSGIIDPSFVLGTVDSPWPASILIGGRALAAVGLPADVKESGWKILLPVSVPITIEAGDRLDDDMGRSFWVESAEFTDLGWRLMTNEAHA
jgi:hypothetical protein